MKQKQIIVNRSEGVETTGTVKHIRSDKGILKGHCDGITVWQPAYSNDTPHVWYIFEKELDNGNSSFPKA